MAVFKAEHMFMFKHVDPRRSPGENARRDSCSISVYARAGWVVVAETADKVYFDRGDRRVLFRKLHQGRPVRRVGDLVVDDWLREVTMAKKPKPVRKPKPRPPRKGY